MGQTPPLKDRAGTPGKGRWDELQGPARVLLYLLILLVLVEVYQRAEFILTRVFGVVLLFVFATIVALLLNPLVDSVEALGPFRGRRALSALAIYLLIFAALASVFALVVPVLATQATNFGTQLPVFLHQAQLQLDSMQAALVTHGLPRLKLPTDVGSGGNLFGSFLLIVTQTLNTVVNLLLITVISIYLLVQGRELIAAMRRLFPAQEHVFDFTLLAAGSTIASYVRGQLVMAGIMGVYTGVTMTLVGVHYGVVLGVVAFFLEFLPLIGAPVAMALAVIVALFQGPALAVFAAGLGLGGHAIEAYVVGPRVTGHATRLHPLAAMAALLIGAELGGILGALFAVPLAGIINVYLGAAYRSRNGEAAFALPPGNSAGPEHLPRLGEEISASAEEQGIVNDVHLDSPAQLPAKRQPAGSRAAKGPVPSRPRRAPKKAAEAPR
ncbi:MAG: AI-2E family transporter [Candidatus Dormibacteria bacterium]